MPKPVVAIVGRPNVGKSTLFNRLVGRSVAIVSKQSGTTRDRVTMETVWADHPFILVDTGGLETFPDTDLWRQIRTQAETAIEDADIIIMVTDITQGVTAADTDVATILRQGDKPVILAVNKADTEETQAQLAEVTAALRELGAAPLVMSAATGDGVQAVLDRVLQALEAAPQPEPPGDAAPPPVQRRRPRRTGTVERDEDGGFIVRWPAAERLVALANVDDHRVVGQLLREFRRRGVTAALEAAGVAPGDIVRIGDWAFPWGEALQPA